MERTQFLTSTILPNSKRNHHPERSQRLRTIAKSSSALGCNSRKQPSTALHSEKMNPKVLSCALVLMTTIVGESCYAWRTGIAINNKNNENNENNAPGRRTNRRIIGASSKNQEEAKQLGGLGEESSFCSSRRSILAALPAASTTILAGQPAFARDELFKMNPLTNPLLEQVSQKGRSSLAMEKRSVLSFGTIWCFLQYCCWRNPLLGYILPANISFGLST